MVAIVISAIAMAAVYSTFIVQQRSFTIQDQVSETQVSSKIAFNMLTDRIMGAGFGYPINQTPTINGVSGIIGAVDAGAGNSPDSIIIVSGHTQVGTLGVPAGQTAVNGEQQFDVALNSFYMDICYSGATVFNTTNYRFLSVDGVHYAEVNLINNTAGLADCNLDGNNETVPRLYIGGPLSADFPANPPTPVYMISGDPLNIVVSNGVNCNAPVGTNCLQITEPSGTTTLAATLATDIEDIQFAYAYDLNPMDGNIDDLNGNGTFDPGDYNSSVPAGAEILAVRANLLASVANIDPRLAPASKPYSAGIKLENGSTIGAGDQFRRRVWSKEILLRNPR